MSNEEIMNMLNGDFETKLRHQYDLGVRVGICYTSAALIFIYLFCDWAIPIFIM